MKNILKILIFLIVIVSNSQTKRLYEEIAQQQYVVVTGIPPIYIGSSVQVASITSPATITAIAAIEVNDFLVIQVFNSDNSTITTPTGFTEIHESSGFTNFVQGAYYKFADATDADNGTLATYSVATSLTADVLFVQMHIYRGVNLTTPYESLQIDEDNLNAVHNFPAITTTGVDRLLTAFVQVGDNRTIPDGSDATTYTNITSVKTTAGTDAWLLMYTQVASTATTYIADSVDFDQSEDGGVILIALTPE